MYRNSLTADLLRRVMLAATIGISMPAAARDWYVDAENGDDTYAGTSTAPLRTLTAGVAAANAGDNVVVRAGRYTDSAATSYSGFNPARSGDAGAPITIRSQPALAAVLVAKDSESVALGVFQRRHIVVEGFRVEGMLKAHESEYITLQNCEVIYGSTEGNDRSLNWGIALHSTHFSTLRSNWVHSMRSSSNDSHNTAAIMVGFGSSDNLIENNEADAGNGIVFSAFGQKGGDLFRNTWRRNIARNARAGFLGMGSTVGDRYSQDNVFYQNVVVDSADAFRLNHNSQRFLIYNNSAYNVDRFLVSAIPAQNIGTRMWNNIAYQSNFVYMREDTTDPDWTRLLSEADYNNFYNAGTVAAWNWGQSRHDTLAGWTAATGFDANSLSADPLFVNAAQGDFKLQSASPAKAVGKPDSNGVRNDLGAYPTGLEVIGVSRAPRPNPPLNVTVE